VASATGNLIEAREPTASVAHTANEQRRGQQRPGDGGADDL